MFSLFARRGQVSYALSAVDVDADEQICFREFLFAAVHCVVNPFIITLYYILNIL